MPDTQFYTRQSAFTKAGKSKATLALSKLRFTQDPYTPSAFSTKVELLAAEATYDGYTAGGLVLTAWSGPDTNAGGGAAINSPYINAPYGPAGDPPVTNIITGWWVELAAGDVWVVGTFSPTINMAAIGDAVNWVRSIIEGMNVALP
jgi:hypothetical protein